MPCQVYMIMLNLPMWSCAILFVWTMRMEDIWKVYIVWVIVTSGLFILILVNRCYALLSSVHCLWSNVQTCLNDHYMVLMVTYAVMSDWSMIMPHLVLVISPHPSTAILSSCYWLVREIIMISQQICLSCHDLQSAQWSFCGLIQKDMPHLVKSDLALHYLSDLALHYLSDHAWSCVKDYA